MQINDDTIHHIASLARLEFESQEREEIKKDLGRIISFVEKIAEADLSAEEPLVYITEEVNVLREDIPVTDITQEQALKNAPRHDSDYFKVPKVLDNPGR